MHTPWSTRSSEHQTFADSARRFVAAEVAPHLEDWRRGGGAPRTVFIAAGENGFLGTAVPDRFGGGDAEDHGFLATVIDETVEAGATGLAVLWALHAGVSIPFLAEHAEDATQEQWLPALVAGELIGIPAPGPVVHGLPGARIADLLLMLDDGVGAVTAVPTGTPGVRIDRDVQNLAGADAAAADVDAANSDPTGCDRIAGAATALRRDTDLWLSVVALAGARRALSLALEYAGDRKVFGKPLAEFENTRLRLAELNAELSSVTTYLDQCLNQRAESTLTAADAAAARYLTVGLSDRAADQSLQFHGGYGYMREYPISQVYADAAFLRTAAQQFSDARETVAAGLFSGR